MYACLVQRERWQFTVIGGGTGGQSCERDSHSQSGVFFSHATKTTDQ